MRNIYTTINIRLTLLLLMLISATAARGNATITVQGPSHVAAGEQFQLRYVVNTTDVTGFRVGNIPDAFDVLMGPSTSTQQSFSMVNGKTTHSSSVTYTYILQAQKKGSFTIPAAKGTIGGKVVNSGVLHITVSGQVAGNNSQGGGRQPQHARVDQAGSRISGSDLFIRATANKTEVYEQEPVLLTYKVYTQVELTQLEGKMPDLNGFHTQEIQLPQQKTAHIESVNGRNYNCITWSQYVMFPQMSGKLKIPSITFKGIVMQQNTNVDPLEAFFNGGSSYVEVKKEIKASSLDINVKPLPQKPANFSGGVGVFSISAKADNTTVKAGDPVNIQVVVKGTGNMKLLKQPELQLPSDFDKYDPKVTENTKLSERGLTGSIVYNYIVVPRNMGQFDIPAISYVYFDTQTHTYKTITTAPIHLNVEKGNNNASAGGKTALSDFDIHDIMTDAPADRLVDSKLWGTWPYILISLLLLSGFIVIPTVARRYNAAKAMSQGRIKKANKVAVKRLKKSFALMKASDTDKFYDEVMRALWGYVGDKFSISVDKLTRSNISDTLQEKQVPQQVIDAFIEAIDECEFARYAPGDSQGNMQSTYDKATRAITEIEENVK